EHLALGIRHTRECRVENAAFFAPDRQLFLSRNVRGAHVGDVTHGIFMTAALTASPVGGDLHHRAHDERTLAPRQYFVESPGHDDERFLHDVVELIGTHATTPRYTPSRIQVL